MWLFAIHDTYDGVDDPAAVNVKIVFFFFQAEDGIRDYKVTGVQTCALPICSAPAEKVCGKTFNIACGGQVTLNQMVDALNRLMGTSISPIHGSERAGDIKQIGRASCRERV